MAPRKQTGERLRDFMRSLYGKRQEGRPTAFEVAKEAGLSGSLVSAFLTGHRGAPLPETLRPLAQATRRALESVAPDLARRASVVRFFIEAEYLQPGDIGEFLELEGYEGWMREEDCLGPRLDKLSDEGRKIVEEMYTFMLLREQEGGRGKFD